MTLEATIDAAVGELPLDLGTIRTDDMSIQDNFLVYDNTITDFTTYQNLKNNIATVKSSYEGMISENPQVGMVCILLADLNMGLRYVFHSAARTSSFTVDISGAEIAQQLGGTIDRNMRLQMIAGYLNFIYPTDGVEPPTVSCDAKGITLLYEPGVKSTDVSFDKSDLSDNVYISYINKDAGRIFFDLSMYLDIPYVQKMIFTDKTVNISLSSHDVYEQYLKAMEYRADNSEFLDNEDGVDYSDVEVVYADPNESDQEGRVGYDGIPMPFQLVEEKPTFMGGDANKFSEWVNANLIYPKIAKDNGVQGRITLQFTVNTDGSVSNVKVLRGVDISLDREAVRVVSHSPKWTPGKQKGIPIKVTYTFPVIFQLQ